MAIEFARSARSTLGLEWEIALVDRATGDLVPHAPHILEALTAGGTRPRSDVTGELLTNTVEVVTGVHRTVGDGVAELRRTIDEVRDAAEPYGADLMCSGTHPFAQWASQEITPKQRYATLIDRTQSWGRRMLIWGVHMHVGIDDRDKVLPIVNALLRYAPHFQALSASSPFAFGEATGYASSRTLLFQQLPTAGVPPQFASWREYEAMVADLTHVGQIDQWDELRWDIRPSPRWGTVEVRVCDGMPTAFEVGALAALVQCLVDDFSGRLDAGETLPELQPWFVRENKWRAARYGTDAIVILNAAGDERLVTDDLAELVERLAPTAERLGCQAELADTLRILDSGASYRRQLAVADAAGGDLRAVVASLVAELRDGAPHPAGVA